MGFEKSFVETEELFRSESLSARNRLQFLTFFLFVRIGSLIQVPPGKGRFRRRLSSFKSEREAVRQCFLFSNYMIIATRYLIKFIFLFHQKIQIIPFIHSSRTSGGRLHLLADVGKIPLVDATLIEDPNDSDREDEGRSAFIVLYG